MAAIASKYMFTFSGCAIFHSFLSGIKVTHKRLGSGAFCEYVVLTSDLKWIIGFSACNFHADYKSNDCSLGFHA